MSKNKENTPFKTVSPASFIKIIVSCGPGWPSSVYVAQDDNEVLILLPLHPQCWDYRSVPRAWLTFAPLPSKAAGARQQPKTAAVTVCVGEALGSALYYFYWHYTNESYVFLNTSLRKLTDRLQISRKYLQIIYRVSETIRTMQS